MYNQPIEVKLYIVTRYYGEDVEKLFLEEKVVKYRYSTKPMIENLGANESITSETYVDVNELKTFNGVLLEFLGDNLAIVEVDNKYYEVDLERILKIGNKN